MIGVFKSQVFWFCVDIDDWVSVFFNCLFEGDWFYFWFDVMYIKV